MENAKDFLNKIVSELYSSQSVDDEALRAAISKTISLIDARDAAFHKAAMEETALYGPALTGWIQVLYARRDELRYTDEYCANEAARLAAYTARAVLGWAEKETI